MNITIVVVILTYVRIRYIKISLFNTLLQIICITQRPYSFITKTQKCTRHNNPTKTNLKN